MTTTKSEFISKKTDTDYPIHKLLQKRWSPRAYSNQSVDPELLNQLFDAARWAPSSYNEQPWRFIVARKEDEKVFAKLSQVLGDYNKTRATDTSVLVLALAKKSLCRRARITFRRAG